jgi:hypothetical protein
LDRGTLKQSPRADSYSDTSLSFLTFVYLSFFKVFFNDNIFRNHIFSPFSIKFAAFMGLTSFNNYIITEKEKNLIEEEVCFLFLCFTYVIKYF